MKKQLKSSFKIAFKVIILSLFTVACSNDDTNVFDTDNTGNGDGDGDTKIEVATLIFNEENPSINVITADANGKVGTTVPGRVIFTSKTKQKRMYITQNISGQGDIPFNDFALTSKDLKKALKADGSIDLDGATKLAIDFTFDLPVPSVDNGTIVYKFWTTTGKGDFRDADMRLALGVGTITVTVGTGTNPTAKVREFKGIKLYAPDLEGKTETFFSLLDEKAYKINEGPEFRAFWDFGYYYTNSSKASFSSTSFYETAFPFTVAGLKPSQEEEGETLNKAFFAISDKEATDFDAISLSGDLNNIEKSDSEKIINLKIGNVVEFVDNYGKKGLIKITDLQAGVGNKDYIRFDVKIQP